MDFTDENGFLLSVLICHIYVICVLLKYLIANIILPLWGFYLALKSSKLSLVFLCIQFDLLKK